MRRGLRDLKKCYYGVDSGEEKISKFLKKIQHELDHRDNKRNSYESYIVLMRYCFQQIKYIAKDAGIRYSQKVKLNIYGFKAKNSEMTM